MKKHNAAFLCRCSSPLSGAHITLCAQCVSLVFVKVVVQVSIRGPQKKDVFVLSVLSRSSNAVSLSVVTGLSQRTSPGARSLPAFVHGPKGRVPVLTEVVVTWEGRTGRQTPSEAK